MFLHQLISEVIAHSLYKNKRRNFARLSYTEQYLQMITYQWILFASTAIKYALEFKLPNEKKAACNSIWILVRICATNAYHPVSFCVLLLEQLSERQREANVLFTRTILPI